MELFAKAKTVRLQTIRDKYLIACDDQENVIQCRNGSSNNAVWYVDIVPGQNFIRLKSCYEKYLTASTAPFIPGVTGKKVLQTLPSTRDDSSIDWEPLRDGMQVRLKSRSGNFLRPNGGLPPWRNSVTHEIPYTLRSQEKLLWDVQVVETIPAHRRLPSVGTAAAAMDPTLHKSSSASAVPTNPQGQEIIRLQSSESKDSSDEEASASLCTVTSLLKPTKTYEHMTASPLQLLSTS